MRYIQQTPASVLDYTVDYTCDLGVDTIISSSWAASSPDCTLSNAGFTTTSATVFLTGGVPQNIYTITNTVITAGGRTFQETLQYDCVAQNLIGC
jgi:hypothetical protein